MNILFTSDLSGIGGGETSLINLCLELQNKHNIVVLCAIDGDLVKILNSNKIKTYVYNYRNKLSLSKTIKYIRDIVKSNNIEVIHNNDPITSIIIKLSITGLNVKNFWTCHGQWYRFSFIKRMLIKRANNYIFCVSSAAYKNLLEQGFKHITVTYLGIPLERYRINNSINTNLPSYKKDCLKLTCIGRYQPIKGQLKLAKAINILKSRNIDVVCYLVGGCVYNNSIEKNYYNAVCTYIEDNNLKEKVYIIGERNDIPQILHQVDALVVPSDNESFGVVAIEALAAELPILSTPNDGVSEILQYNPHFISKTNDEIGLANLIQYYVNNPSIKEEAHKFAMNRMDDFSIVNIAKKYEEIFLGEK